MKICNVMIVFMLLAVVGVALFTNIDIPRLMIALVSIIGAGLGIDLFSERYLKEYRVK